MIREGFMQVGEWDVTLLPEAPLSVRSVADHYWQLVVTPSRVPGLDASRSDVVANARYRGPLLEMSDDRTRLRGAGMLHYLTWSENEAPGPAFGQAWDWSDYLLEMESNHSQWTQVGLDLQAVVDEPTDTWPDSTADSSDDLPTNMFDELLFLAGVLGCEFYVNAQREFHSGGADSSSLWTTTPTVILMRGQSGRDIDLIGLPIASWGVDDDAWDHATSVSVYGTGGTGATSSVLFDSYAADGSASTREVIEVSATIDNANDAGRRVEAIAAEHKRRRVVEVSVDEPDPGRWIKPGDYLWAFDPLNDVTNTAQATYYHGMHVTPAKLRLYGMRWPIVQGMGVYLVNKDASATPAVVDLTDFVAWESGPSTFEVDAPRRAALMGA